MAEQPVAARALRDAVSKVALTIGEHPYSGSARPEIVHRFSADRDSA